MTEEMKMILRLLANGKTLDQQLIHGGCIILGDSPSTSTSVSISTKMDMENAGYIEYSHTMGQGHLMFHGKAVIYKITELGREIIR